MKYSGSARASGNSGDSRSRHSVNAVVVVVGIRRCSDSLIGDIVVVVAVAAVPSSPLLDSAPVPDNEYQKLPL